MKKEMTKTYEQDGPEAREIAQHLPYFPFKGIPRFYDIGGFLKEPSVFQKIVDIFVERYREIGIDSVAGYVRSFERNGKNIVFHFFFKYKTDNLSSCFFMI